MTVKELIEILKNHPENMKVLVSGYEGGYDNTLKEDIVVIKTKEWDHCPSWEGQFYESSDGEPCLVIQRGNHN